MLFRGIRKIWRPAIYQGKANMRGYFEGWYYKFTDKSENHIYALIPGVSFNKKAGNSHCFIQFLDNAGISSHYFSYDIKQFSYSPDKPEIIIGDNFFSPARIEININDKSNVIRGSMNFMNLTPWPVSLLSPGAMGWYAFIPMMECYHGVLSFDHTIQGNLKLNGETIDFNGGRGYIEKDWGRSFPSYHIWIQTNHFDRPGTSLMVSIANIPWLGKSFDGFLIGLWHNAHLFKFTTYNGARITAFKYDRNNLLIHAQSKRYRIEVELSYQRGAELRTPVQGEMQGRLSESLTAETKVNFYEKSTNNEQLIFTGTGRHSGLEIEGRIPSLLNL